MQLCLYQLQFSTQRGGDKAISKAYQDKMEKGIESAIAFTRNSL